MRSLKLWLVCCVGTMVLCGIAVAQGAGDYTALLPPVQRVESEIKGTDPTDTLARQIAVLRKLQNYITETQNSRGVRAAATPGEQKALGTYRQAEMQLTQGYASSHTPDQVTAFSRVCGRYVFDQGLDQAYEQLLGQKAVEAKQASDAQLHESAARAQQRQQQAMSGGGRARTGSSADTFGGVLPSMENDPGIRRCLELGSTLDQCMGGSLNDMGKAAEAAAARFVGTDVNAGKPRNGVILVGLFRSRTEQPELELTADGKAILRKCGSLVDQNAGYALRKNGATTQLAIGNQPAAILLTLRSDGSLAGPGSVAVRGSVVAGYQNQANCPVGTPIANCRTTTMPVYAASTQRCIIGQLMPEAAPAAASKDAGLPELAGALSDMLNGRTSGPVNYGLRLVGTYANSGGMKLDFENRFVTLDCGKAHVNAPYSVADTPGGFVVQVRNAGGAFQLTVAPDGTLRGTGSTTVNGRLVSSFREENVSFTPHSETCAVGVFAPQGGVTGR